MLTGNHGHHHVRKPRPDRHANADTAAVRLAESVCALSTCRGRRECYSSLVPRGHTGHLHHAGGVYCVLSTRSTRRACVCVRVLVTFPCFEKSRRVWWALSTQ